MPGWVLDRIRNVAHLFDGTAAGVDGAEQVAETRDRCGLQMGPEIMDARREGDGMVWVRSAGEPLSPQEADVLYLRGWGWTHAQIGRDAGLSASRVGRVLKQARAALGVTSDVEAVAEAVRRGLIAPAYEGVCDPDAMGDGETTWFDHEGNAMTAPASEVPTGWGLFDRLTHRLMKPPPGRVVQAITWCGRRVHEVPGRGGIDCPECLAKMRGEDPADRFHLTLDAGDWPCMQGWWADRKTADAKFKEWVDEHGRPGCRITLVDEETGATLTTWPTGT